VTRPGAVLAAGGWVLALTGAALALAGAAGVAAMVAGVVVGATVAGGAWFRRPALVTVGLLATTVAAGWHVASATLPAATAWAVAAALAVELGLHGSRGRTAPAADRGARRHAATPVLVAVAAPPVTAVLIVAAAAAPTPTAGVAIAGLVVLVAATAAVVARIRRPAA
jgi:hypothetical protein